MRTGPRTIQKIFRPQPLIALLLVAALVGCGLSPRRPDPEISAAANELAADIRSYRASVSAEGDTDADDVELFAKIFQLVRNEYVHETTHDQLMLAATKGMREAHPDPAAVNDRVLVASAIDAMLESLDSYSSYLDPSEHAAIQESTRGEFGGLGIQIQKKDDLIEVVSPIDDTPAMRAGIKSGDKITHADGEVLKPLSLREAVTRLRGKVGTSVVLSIRREGVNPFDVRIEREIIRTPAVRWHMEKDDVGYLRITSFISERTTAELIAAMTEIREEAGNSLHGLIIDMRNNPGGLFDQGLEVADAFLDDGVIVSTRGRHNERAYPARPGDLVEGLPIVVLVNNGSASAAEIVAGALKYLGRATLLGTKTYGKGSVQTIIRLDRADALKLTTAIYITPSGKSVEGGITPDVEVKDIDETEADEALLAALDIIRRQ